MEKREETTFQTEKLLVSIEDAARALGISRTLLYGAISKNLIRTVKLGRSRRIHIDEVKRIADHGLNTGDGAE